MSEVFRIHRPPLRGAAACWTRHLLLPLLFILSLFIGALPPLTAAAPVTSRVLPQLQREAAEQPGRTFRVIVTRLNKDTAGDRAVRAAGGRKLKDLLDNAFVAEVPGRAIDALARNPAIKYVSIDALMRPTGSTIDSSKLGMLYPRVINASGLWASSLDRPALTGAGVGVAILDTGINDTLPDWKGTDGTSRIVAQAKFNANTEHMSDGHGHGTHVAGIVAGNSWHRTETALQGKYIGIAPEANLINVKVSDDQGMSYISDVVMGIDWVIDNRERYNIRVMNLSLQSTVMESYRTSTLAAAVELAWFNGIFVVVAAGNAGPDTMYYPPANDPFVVTVGAADPMGSTTRSDDGMAPWSSYGITQDGFSKPEVVAPGRHIVAPLASNGSVLATLLADRTVDGSYLRLSGTSMAAPVVAGLAALAFEANLTWTNDQVKWLLQHTATPLTSVITATDGTELTTLLPGQGAGQVDAEAVVGYSGTPGQANQAIPISAQLVGPDGEMIYNADTITSTASTWSASTWSASTWSASTWSASTWSASTWSSTTNSVSCELDCDSDIE